MDVFRQILATRSMTVITCLAEDAMSKATGKAREALEAICEAERLDEAYAIAHEQLGNMAEATRLRQWMATRRRCPVDPQLAAPL